jgi:CRP/FNR family transcriptional regulator, nitrogen fixation regulation protein
MPPVDLMHNDRRVSSQTPLDILTALAATKRYRRGGEIYSQYDPVEYQYRVVSGAARRLTVQASGRRRIVDFLLPGDFFGFARRREHAFSVEAVVEGTVIARYPRARIDKLVGSDPGLGHLICEATPAEICRLQRPHRRSRADHRAGKGQFLPGRDGRPPLRRSRQDRLADVTL